MKIIIAGAGKVGHTVAALLAEEGHDITIIDRDPDTIQILSNSLDVICVEGSATNSGTLREAGAEKADLLLAATEQDEVNMICGISARKLGTAHVIARVRDPEYLHQTEFLRETLGLSVLVNPEYECAKEISRALRFPGAVRVDSFSKGSLEIVEHKIPAGGKLEGVALKELVQRFGAKILVGVVERGREAMIPNGNFVLQAGDRLSITGESRELRRFFTAIGQFKRPVRRVMIMGGGRSAVYLTRMLQESGMEVTVVERDRERCELLCDLIPQANIICGDATRSDVLQEDGLSAADAFVALTGDDEDNIITSLYAKSCGVGSVVVKVNRDYLDEILDNVGLTTIVSPKEIVAQQLTRYVRAMSNSMGGSMETLYRLADGKVEALEFKVSPRSACVNIPLKDLKLKPNILITAIIRGSKSIIPDGSSRILPGDHAVIVTAAGRLQNLDSIVEESR
ncbi:MAG: Trk system potassium transporter TrkA [Oscillospiraceae bacterium]|nr:Trk system potassium transporter TrkA [Oscillospiraceae bacterium]